MTNTKPAFPSFFVMSDIHGCYDEMMQALTHWDKDNETLVVLGDLIDRGPDSLRVVQALRALQTDYPEKVVVLQGNHDEMFARWLVETDPNDLGFYYMTTHNETIKSFFGQGPEALAKYKNSTRTQRAEHIRYLYMDSVRFLYNLPLYHETEHCIFVHAGINLKIDDWHQDTTCMNTVLNAFIYGSVPTPKRVFFGHTPGAFIRNVEPHEPGANDVWQNEAGDRIGIDGAVSMNGQLNALKVDANGHIVETIVVKLNTWDYLREDEANATV